MDSTSQVILRNERRLPPTPLLLVNAPRDGLSLALAGRACEVRHSTQDFGDCRWLQSGGMDARFECVPTLRGDEGLVVLHLAREKERLAMLLHALAAQMNPDTRLWLVGENRAGIKSAPGSLERVFGRVTTLDKARHCGLFEASQPLDVPSFSLARYLRDWSVGYAGQVVRLRTLPGVFAHGRLDAGTALLLELLEELQPGGPILDFGCGSGVVGVALRVASSMAAPTLLDSSALALESCRESLRANGVDGRLLPSDGLAEVRSRFDWIVSNPPFHRGVRNHLDVAATFIRRAGTVLTEGGSMVVVFNRHLPYLAWLQQAFAEVQRLAQNTDFTVALACRPVAGQAGRTGSLERRGREAITKASRRPARPGTKPGHAGPIVRPKDKTASD